MGIFALACPLVNKLLSRFAGHFSSIEDVPSEKHYNSFLIRMLATSTGEKIACKYSTDPFSGPYRIHLVRGPWRRITENGIGSIRVTDFFIQGSGSDQAMLLTFIGLHSKNTRFEVLNCHFHALKCPCKVLRFPQFLTSIPSLLMTAVRDMPNIPGNVMPIRPRHFAAPFLKAQFAWQKQRSKA